MSQVFDAAGEGVGALWLSPKELAVLEAGAAIEVRFHTPRMLQGVLGTRSGKFGVRVDGGRWVTDAPGELRAYLALQEGIRAAARELGLEGLYSPRPS